jgi:hypothetical protein
MATDMVYKKENVRFHHTVEKSVPPESTFLAVFWG